MKADIIKAQITFMFFDCLSWIFTNAAWKDLRKESKSITDYMKTLDKISAILDKKGREVKP